MLLGRAGVSTCISLFAGMIGSSPAQVFQGMADRSIFISHPNCLTCYPHSLKYSGEANEKSGILSTELGQHLGNTDVAKANFFL